MLPTYTNRMSLLLLTALLADSKVADFLYLCLIVSCFPFQISLNNENPKNDWLFERVKFSKTSFSQNPGNRLVEIDTLDDAVGYRKIESTYC